MSSFEVHITVKSDQHIEHALHAVEALRLVSATQGDNAFKVLLVEGDVGNGLDLMTSSVHKADNLIEAIHFLDHNVAPPIKAAGFDIIRRKIEISPALQSDSDWALPLYADTTYFERHVGIYTSVDRPSDMLKLREVAIDHNCFISRNVLKDNGRTRVMMLTARCKHDTDVAEITAEASEQLHTLGFDIVDNYIEFAAYDSNIHHDDHWMKY